MKITLEYKNADEKQTLLAEHSDKYLVEEKNLFEGKFLVFTDIKPVEIEIIELKQEIRISNAKNNALSERADFIEDVVAEMAIQVYQ
ncbi:hypothetical protein QT711_07210 [Sporosarcina saromensis]|uniref:Phage protein n=1 Tax=Sporosarcina saromensis TaxID=359365 RepID=A0ABU4G7M3_9BACL|nr:hypothetical protein [Sporosarcina saromensis]MDW0112969.1 hypothetical protein [Sporosarcina saromensis]